MVLIYILKELNYWKTVLLYYFVVFLSNSAHIDSIVGICTMWTWLRRKSRRRTEAMKKIDELKVEFMHLHVLEQEKKNISHALPLTSEPALRMECMCKSNKTCIGKNYDQLIINDFDCIFTCTDHLTYLIKMFSLFSVFVILAAPAPRSCSLMRISVWNGLRFFLMSIHGLQVIFCL